MVYSIQYPELLEALLQDLHVQGVDPNGNSDITSWTPPDFESSASKKLLAGHVLLKSLSKRWIGGGMENAPSPAEREQKAKDLFQEVNLQCSAMNEKFRTGHMTRVSGPLSDFRIRCLEAAREFLHNEFFWHMLEDSSGVHMWDNDVPVKTVARNFAIGNGKSTGNPWNDFLGKIVDGPLTFANPLLVRLLPSFFKVSAQCFDLDGRERPSRPGNTRILSHIRTMFEDMGKFAHVEGGRLSTVPKSYLIDRTIGTEPLLEGLFQQGLGRTMREYLVRYGIDLSEQAMVNKAMAQKASISGQEATIDLSSASDRNCIGLVEYLLPQSWVWWLKTCRCDKIRIDDEYVDLHMMSSMGNAFTFPLQTIIYLALIVGVARTRGYELHFYGKDRNVSVYGDDIIVPTELYYPVCDLLVYVGHVVNMSKSYVTGFFRESCGGDYLNGLSVRGVFVEKLDTPQERVSFLNRLMEFGARFDLAFVHIFRLVFHESYLIVPMEAPEDSGFRMPYEVLILYEEAKAPVRLENCIFSRKASGRRIHMHTAEMAFYMWRPRANKFAVAVKERGTTFHNLVPRFKNLYNGVLAHVLRGGVSNYHASYRDDSLELVYDKVRVGCAGWHLDPPGGGLECPPCCDDLTKVIQRSVQV